MVKHSFARRFFFEEDGISLTEGLIVFPIMVLAITAFIEFGYGMWQWNQTAKALQYGARVAAVSDPVVDEEDFDEMLPPVPSDTALIPGVIALNEASVTCGPEFAGPGCNADRIKRLAYGMKPDLSGPNEGCTTSVRAMCRINPDIKAERLVITYEPSGLGYWGRPGGRVVTTRLEVSGMTIRLPVIGSLIGIDELIPMPAFPVSVASEDLCTADEC